MADPRRHAPLAVLVGGTVLLGYAVVLGVAGVIAETRPRVVPSLEQAPPPSNLLPAEAEPPAAPGWRVEESGGGGDVPTVLLTLPASSEVAGWRGTARPLLFVRCMEGETRILVHTGVPLEPGPERGGVPVEVRLDSGAADEGRWMEANGAHALIAPQPGAAFAKRLASGGRLHVRFRAFNAGQQTAEFDLAGLSDVLPRVAGACGWTYP